MIEGTGKVADILDRHRMGEALGLNDVLPANH
jgi:hypothetical protein